MDRTFNYVFLLDSAFVIFHNSVPRMVLQEMQLDLSCSEAWFQAPSHAEFVSAVHSEPGLYPSTISLVDAVRLLCADNPDQAAEFLGGASKLNLFTIATGRIQCHRHGESFALANSSLSTTRSDLPSEILPFYPSIVSKSTQESPRPLGERLAVELASRSRPGIATKCRKVWLHAVCR